MKNIEEEIKKIISNKNTLTILIVLASVFALYFVYSSRIDAATKTISVPYAKEEITSRSQITSDLIGTVSIPKNVASSLGIVTAKSSVLEKYVAYGNTIPANSFFYSSLLTDFEEAQENEFTNIPDGYKPFTMSVTNATTYGNSIYAGNYIDLYLKTTSNKMIVFGKYIESIQVLAVWDNEGNDVFESSSEDRTPAYMVFAVPEDLYIKLQTISGKTGMELVPVPRNSSYSANPGETQITSGSGTYLDKLVTGGI